MAAANLGATAGAPGVVNPPPRQAGAGAGATQDFMEALLESVPCHEAPGVFKLICLGLSTTWENSICPGLGQVFQS